LLGEFRMLLAESRTSIHKSALTRQCWNNRGYRGPQAAQRERRG
jgi:hypothetical protein